MMTHIQMHAGRLGSLAAYRLKEYCSEQCAAQLHGHLLDMMTLSIIATDSERRILYANRQGNQFLTRGRTLRDAMGRLSAANPSVAAQLSAAISECANGNLGKIGRNGIPVLITSEHEQSLVVWVLPLCKPDGGCPRTVAILGRSEPDSFCNASFACRYNNATPSELRIVEMLMQGMGTEEIAVALSISDNTVKTHLKNLFVKTGTRRQVDLLRVANATITPAAWIG